MTDKKVALVTGANRGLGLEISRQLGKLGICVVLGVQDAIYGVQSEESLRSEGIDAVFHQLDVTDINSIQSVVQLVQMRLGRLDILVNNAGILVDEGLSGLKISLDVIKETLDTNTYGPLRLCQEIIPLMQLRNYGRIVNISSEGGLYAEMVEGYLAFQISKAALNAVTVTLANEFSDSNILINAMSPGWVKTVNGGASAARTVEEGADTVVYLATLPDGSPTGKFFKDRVEIPW